MLPGVKPQPATRRPATRRETIEAILKRSNRHAVPIRRSFVQRAKGGPRPPLAEMVRRHDDRALDFYLLILAQASAGAFDVSRPAPVWARALGVVGKNPAAAVSKLLARLVADRLVKRDRVGRQAHVTLLREDGSGAPYTHPGQVRDKYLQLPHAYWLEEWNDKLTFAGKAALLIARSMPAEFFLVVENAPNQFGISADSLAEGLAALRGHNLLHRWTIYPTDPDDARGYREEHRYELRPPFAQRARAARIAPAAPGNP